MVAVVWVPFLNNTARVGFGIVSPYVSAPLVYCDPSAPSMVTF